MTKYEEVLEALYILEAATACQISKETGIANNTAGSILSKVYSYGKIGRKRGTDKDSRECLYFVNGHPRSAAIAAYRKYEEEHRSRRKEEVKEWATTEGPSGVVYTFSTPSSNVPAKVYGIIQNMIWNLEEGFMDENMALKAWGRVAEAMKDGS